MWSYLPFMGFLFSCLIFFLLHYLFVNFSPLIGGKFLLLKGAPRGWIAWEQRMPRPQSHSRPYPDPQLHYRGSTSPSQGESQIARDGWKEIISVPYCPWEAVPANWYPSNKAITIRISALCVKPLRNFTFNLYLGTSWQECFAAIKIANESVQTGSRKDGNKIKRTSWRPNPEAVADPDYENIWKIFVYFGCQIHNEGLPGENCCFLAFKFQVSLTGPSGFCQKMSWSIPFFHRKIFIFWNFWSP